MRLHAGRAFQPFRQLVPGNSRGGVETDILAVAFKKWLQIFQTQRGGELRVGAELRMSVKRQV